MVSEKISMFFPTISLWELLIHRVGQFGFQGLDWQDLCYGALDVASYILIYMVSKKKVFKVSPKISLWKL